MSQEIFCRLNDPGPFYVREKGPTLQDERTLTYILRDRPGMADSIFAQGGDYATNLARLLTTSHQYSQDSILLNIGDGLGHNSSSLSNSLQQILETSPCIFNIDLSSTLLKEQQKRLADAKNIFFTQANALNLPFANNSLDGIVMNEVISDLPCVEMTPQARDLVDQVITHGRDLNDFQPTLNTIPETEVAQLCCCIELWKKYQLPIPEGVFKETGVAQPIAFQTGIIHTLEELYRIIKPNQPIWISEYGDMQNTTAPVQLYNHTEWSVPFNIITQAAESIGFQTVCKPIAEWLDIREQTLVFEYNYLTGTMRLTPQQYAQLYPQGYSRDFYYLKKDLNPEVEEQLRLLQSQGFNCQGISEAKLYFMQNYRDEDTWAPRVLEPIKNYIQQFYGLVLIKLK